MYHKQDITTLLTNLAVFNVVRMISCGHPQCTVWTSTGCACRAWSIKRHLTAAWKNYFGTAL